MRKRKNRIVSYACLSVMIVLAVILLSQGAGQSGMQEENIKISAIESIILMGSNGEKVASELNVSSNTELEHLNCADNNITELEYLEGAKGIEVIGFEY